VDTLWPSTGVLRYSVEPKVGRKLIVEVDPAIVELARALVPKWVRLNRQKYRPHISVVRWETPSDLTRWGAYEGEEVEFLYSSIVQFDDVYWWLDVQSTRLNEIRVQLGLPEWRTGRDGFHLTIGNTKEHLTPDEKEQRRWRAAMDAIYEEERSVWDLLPDE
jgi:hypothetical protein